MGFKYKGYMVTIDKHEYAFIVQYFQGGKLREQGHRLPNKYHNALEKGDMKPIKRHIKQFIDENY